MAHLIAIEGIDGSGKGTQSKRLVETLCESGHRVGFMGFPRYSETFFGARVGDFLNGRFGELWDLPPFLISLLFAGDRLESRSKLLEQLEGHDLVILDRYVGSNMAHQSARCSDAGRREVQDWIEHVEFEIHQMPKPTLNILLDLPVATAQEFVLKKAARDYTSQAADLQEADAKYLSKVRETYLDLANRSANWEVISVTGDAGTRSIDSVAADILATINNLLGPSP